MESYLILQLIFLNQSITEVFLRTNHGHACLGRSRTHYSQSPNAFFPAACQPPHLLTLRSSSYGGNHDCIAATPHGKDDNNGVLKE
jgi:hypothetical protein